MSKLKTVKDLDLNGKKALVRVDYNVPVENGVIGDETRIEESLPTIKYLAENGAEQIILMSHLGKPQKEIKGGKAEADVKKKLTLAPVAEKLKELLKEDVAFADFNDPLPAAKYVLLENTRFDKREESKESSEREEFAKKLFELAGENSVYVNDAFGTCHRKHASVYDIARLMPSAAGFLVEKEIKALTPFLTPGESSVAILGGAKIEDKIAAIGSLLKKYSNVLLGGGMIFTFYKAQGYEIGNSFLNKEMIGEAKKLIEEFKDKLILPEDVVITRLKDKEKKLKEMEEGDFENIKMVSPDSIPSGYIGLDIGSDTIDRFSAIIKGAKTIFWNGPVGLFEVDAFAYGTNAIAEAIADNKEAKKIAGGGESAAAIRQGNYDIPLSTGGGASLEFLEKGTLPCIEALKGNFS